MFGVAVFTALGTTAVGTAVAPTRLTLAGTVAGPTPIPVGPSSPQPQPAAPEQDAVRATIPDAAAALPGGAPPVASLTGYRWPLAHARITLPFGRSPWGEWIVGGELGPRRRRPGDVLRRQDRRRARRDGPRRRTPFRRQLGWIGDLRAYYARLDAKKLWTTLPIVVVIDDGNGYRSIYAHFGKIAVKTGQTVKAGDLLGYEGRTGHASGCHLHYGLFSPFETATFAIDPAVAKRMKLPADEIARIDPLLVLPPRSKPTPKPSPAPAEPDAPSSIRWGPCGPAVAGSSAAAVASGDEPVGRDRGQRRRQSRAPAIAALEREEPVGRGGVGRPGIDLGQVDRDPAGLGDAEARHERRGPAARLVLGADLGLGSPRRLAEQDRPPGIADVRRHGAVTGRRLGREPLAACPAGRLVEQRVLVEVGVAAELIGRRAVAEDRPDRRPEDLAEVEVDRAHGPVEVDLLVHEPARGQEHLERRRDPARRASARARR